MKKVPKVVVIGLDAATWTLIRPWMAEGRMPNLAKLMKAGVSGTLESILPPITPPAWTSFMTGKNPGKHGIFHFVETEHGGYAMNYANATSRRSPTVWKLLNDAGYSVGTMNIPFTYPPETSEWIPDFRNGYAFRDQSLHSSSRTAGGIGQAPR